MAKFGSQSAATSSGPKKRDHRAGQKLAKQKSYEKQAKRKKIKLEELTVFTQQIAAMLEAGLPLVAALEALEEQSDNPVFQIIIRNVKNEVSAGRSFSDSCRDYPRAFPTLFVSMVEAGEASGSLAEILDKTSTYFEETVKLMKQVKGALVYPSVVIGLAIILVNVLLIFVIPVFSEMFTGFGAELPKPTQLLIGFSDFLKTYIIFLIMGLVGIFTLVKRFCATPKGRVIKDNVIIKLPVIGELTRKVNLSRFCRTYAEKYVGIQKEQFKRLGVLAEWDKPYLTMNYDYEAATVAELGKLYLNGSVYRGKKPVYWCASCKTALAEAEVEYAGHKTPSIYVKFPVVSDISAKFPPLKGEKASVVIWTTTPWTLPANLAVALSQMGKRVLLVDTDLRKSTLHRVFHRDRSPGLVTVLVEKEWQTVLETAIRETETTGLYLLAAGERPPNPNEMLASEKMGQLIDLLSKRFDFILFDTPPLLQISDAVVLSQRLDGVVLVVRGGKTSKDSLKDAAELLSKAQTDIIGVVLNDIDFRRERYYYAYQYKYYGKYYDEEGAEGTKRGGKNKQGKGGKQ